MIIAHDACPDDTLQCDLCNAQVHPSDFESYAATCQMMQMSSDEGWLCIRCERCAAKTAVFKTRGAA